MGLKHIKVSAVADSADTTLVQPSDWNSEHVIAGGNLGALLYQGTAGAPSLINSVAAGILCAAGAGSVPVWRTELKVTATEVTSTVPIDMPNNVYLRFKDSGGTLRNALGISTGNFVVVGGSAALNGVDITGVIQGYEQTAPSAPVADAYRLFAKDNGSGKTQLMVIFSSGAAQQIAIQP